MMQAKVVSAQGRAEESQNTLVLSFLAVRRAIGLLGFALPFALLALGRLQGTGTQDSISAFYYTPAGEVFLGVLCAIGVFLLTYTGYERRPDEFWSDRWVARAAGFFVICVALIPTTGPATSPLPLARTFLPEALAGKLHYAAAALFFTALAVFCFFIFPRRDKSKPLDARKKREIWTYYVCGAFIVLSVLALGSLAVFEHILKRDVPAWVAGWNAIFWLEALGVWAFGISWLRKGKAMGAVDGLRQALTLRR